MKNSKLKFALCGVFVLVSLSYPSLNPFLSPEGQGICQAASIADALPVIFGHEGGLQCDKADPGNWPSGKVGKGKRNPKIDCTKFGIARNSNPKLDIVGLTNIQAGNIIANGYAKPFANISSQGLLTEFVDKSVNMGEGTAESFVNQTAINFCAIVKGLKCPEIEKSTKVNPETIAFINKVTKTEYYSNITETNLTKEECGKSKEQGLIDIETFDNGNLKLTKEYCIEDKSNRVLFWLMFRQLAGKRYIKLVEANSKLKPFFLSWMIRDID